MKLHSLSAEQIAMLVMSAKAAARPWLAEDKRAAEDAWMRVDAGLPFPVLSKEEQAAQACDPNLVQLTGGRRNSEVYQGQLIERQREALAAWKETDTYRDAYLKKKKKKRPRSEWIPQSREYQTDAIMKHSDPSMLGKPDPAPEKPPHPYRSLEYKVETKKDPTVPPHEGQRKAYESFEYQQACPVPPIAYQGVPLGNTPEEGPWIEVFDSMWNSFWVTLKDLDLGEAAKKDEFLGYDLNSDKIA